MTNIYIGFSRPKKWAIGSSAIMLWTNSNCSHTYIRFESDKIQSTVYHAAHGMVHFVTQDHFLDHNTVIDEFALPIDSDKRIDVMKWCMDQCGEKYSQLELIKIFIHDCLYRLFKLIPDFGDSRGYICSELVAKLLKYKWNLDFKKPVYLLSPKDVRDTLKSNSSITNGIN
jgi:hypothetical protein